MNQNLSTLTAIMEARGVRRRGILGTLSKTPTLKATARAPVYAATIPLRRNNLCWND